MKKIISAAAALAIAAAMSACGGTDSGSASYENTYAEVTTTAGKDIVTDKTVVMGELVGSYTGEMKDGLVDGEGTWICQNWPDCPGVVAQIDGVWTQGNIWNGTSEFFYNGYSLGKVNILGGAFKEEEFETIEINYSNALDREEWDSAFEDIKKGAGIIKDILG